MNKHLVSLAKQSLEAAQERADLHEFIRNRLKMIATTPITLTVDGDRIGLVIRCSPYITYGVEYRGDEFTQESTWKNIESWLKCLNYWR